MENANKRGERRAKKRSERERETKEEDGKEIQVKVGSMLEEPFSLLQPASSRTCNRT